MNQLIFLQLLYQHLRKYEMMIYDGYTEYIPFLITHTPLPVHVTVNKLNVVFY